VLYDVENDPTQTIPVSDEAVEKYFGEKIAEEFEKHDAPRELYQHFNLQTTIS
jgi:hypothetical protein